MPIQRPPDGAAPGPDPAPSRQDGARAGSVTGAAPADPSQPASQTRTVLRSADLLNGAREVCILHGMDAYRLRVTSNDKLILTK
jgi:hemin uptake protein HemP